MFFTSIIEINRIRKGTNRLRKEISRLLSKGMSNISLKIPIEKNWHSQNFVFLILKYLSPGQFLASTNSRRDH